MKNLVAPSAVGLTLAASLHAAPAQAGWVSRTGSDANLCARVSPCRTFQRAHDVNRDFGIPDDTVSCLDADDFGSVSITVSMTIDCSGILPEIRPSGLFLIGIRVNAPGIVVTIRGLRIIGQGAGNMGVYFQNGSTLHIDNVLISGYRGNTRIGIYFAPPAGTVGELHVTDSIINDNGAGDGGAGIAIVPAASGIANVSILRTKVQNNAFGIVAASAPGSGGTRVSIADSISSGAINSGIGATSAGGGAPINMMLSNVVSANNGTIGVIADGAATTIRMSGSTITGNQTFGVTTSGGGTLLSYKNNTIGGNGNDGTPITAFPGPGGTPLQ